MEVVVLAILVAMANGHRSHSGLPPKHTDIIDVIKNYEKADQECKEQDYPGAVFELPGASGTCCHHGNVESNVAEQDFDESRDCPPINRCLQPGYVGCYKEHGIGEKQTLPCTSCQAVRKTNGFVECKRHCRKRSCSYAFILNGTDCYCRNALPDHRNKVSNLECVQKSGVCSQPQACGGENRFAVHETAIGACGGVMSTSNGWIFSPNYPDAYSGDNDCMWIVTGPNGTVFNVTLKMFYLDPMIRIPISDKVVFFDLKDRGDVTLTSEKKDQELRGCQPHEIGVTTQNVLRVHFRSSFSSNGQGFAVRFEAIPDGKDAGGRLTTLSEDNGGELLTSEPTGQSEHSERMDNDFPWTIPGFQIIVVSLLVLIVFMNLAALLVKPRKRMKKANDKKKPLSNFSGQSPQLRRALPSDFISGSSGGSQRHHWDSSEAASPTWRGNATLQQNRERISVRHSNQPFIGLDALDDDHDYEQLHSRSNSTSTGASYIEPI
ncbi:kremen protein 2-like [Ptychodera flava]|uniref:kremen protein 2-like n=1 Tax=Ptychodera flava TaxID=63121 RepID=UPI00396A50A8